MNFMTFTEYQNLAQRTADSTQKQEMRLAIAGLGITGEAGEVADLIKKHIGHGHDLDFAALVKELGDVMWYIQEISFLLNLPLDFVAHHNIEKLKKRYPEGFSTERSVNRVD